MLRLFCKSRVWKEFGFWKTRLLMILPIFVLCSVIVTVFAFDGAIWGGVSCALLLGIPTFGKIIFSPTKSELFAVGDKCSGWRLYYVGKSRWRFVAYDGDEVQLCDVVDVYPNEDYNAVIVEDANEIRILFAYRGGKLYKETLGAKTQIPLYLRGGVVTCCVQQNDGLVAKVVDVAIMKDWKIYADILMSEDGGDVTYHDYLYYDHVVNNVERNRMLADSWDYVYVVQSDAKGVCAILEIIFNEDGYVSNILRIDANCKHMDAYVEGYSTDANYHHYEFNNITQCYERRF